MRFGLSLPHYGFSLPGGEPVTFEAMAAWAHRAEELGFDSVWISDHFFYSFARYGADPQPIASARAHDGARRAGSGDGRVSAWARSSCARRSDIRPSWRRWPPTIDQLSGGRLDLGIGAGWLEEEFEAFGFPFGTVGERFEALEETLAVLDALFSGAAGDLRRTDGHAP